MLSIYPQISSGPGRGFHVLVVGIPAYYQGKYKDNEGNEDKLYAELVHINLRSTQLSPDSFQAVGPGPDKRRGHQDREPEVIDVLSLCLAENASHP
jgi:hypothetical protein